MCSCIVCHLHVLNGLGDRPNGVFIYGGVSGIVGSVLSSCHAHLKSQFKRLEHVLFHHGVGLVGWIHTLKFCTWRLVEASLEDGRVSFIHQLFYRVRGFC